MPQLDGSTVAGHVTRNVVALSFFMESKSVVTSFGAMIVHFPKTLPRVDGLEIQVEAKWPSVRSPACRVRKQQAQASSCSGK